MGSRTSPAARRVPGEWRSAAAARSAAGISRYRRCRCYRLSGQIAKSRSRRYGYYAFSLIRVQLARIAEDQQPMLVIMDRSGVIDQRSPVPSQERSRIASPRNIAPPACRAVVTSRDGGEAISP